MALQTGSQADLGYAVEEVYGVARKFGDGGTPAPAAYTAVRRKSAAGLNLTKDSYDSEEIRTDRMLIDSRHGVRRAGGDVETEMSPNSYDDFWIALLGAATLKANPANRGWTLGSGITASVTVSSAANVLTATTTTTVIKVGDRISITLAADTLNNGDYTVIGAATSGTTVLTLDRTPAGAAFSSDAILITVTGKKALVGAVANSFTLERAFLDIDRFQAYTGMRVNSAAVSLPPTGLATITWNFLGQNAGALTTFPVQAASSGTALDVAYTAGGTNSVLAAVNGVLAISDATNGARTLGVVTDLSFTVDNQLGGSEVVGKNFIPEILWGNTQMITGKVTVLFEDGALYNLFEGESEAALVFRMDGPSDQAAKFLQFTFPRCKFNTGSIGDAVATGLPVEMEFRALKPRSTDTYLNQSQIVVQTSV